MKVTKMPVKYNNYIENNELPILTTRGQTELIEHSSSNANKDTPDEGSRMSIK